MSLLRECHGSLPRPLDRSPCVDPRHLRSTQAELAAELVQTLRQGFQEQYLTPELVEAVLRSASPEEAVRGLLERPAPGWEALPRPTIR